MDSSNSTFERRVLGRRFYPEPVITSILEQIATGRTVTEICADPAMPCAASWFRWCSLDPQLQAASEAARRKAAVRRSVNE